MPAERDESMRRVVVIDDEYIVVAGMTAILDRLNLDFHIVASASNGIDGQEVIRREKPDVVFTDKIGRAHV